MTISPEYRPRLVVMVKEPHPGKVKTRLGKSIGMTAAAWWFRHQTADLLRRIQDPRWQTIIAVSPDHEGMRSRVWPETLPRWPQGRGNLGTRMARIFACVGRGPTIIIGADIPGLQKPHIANAFTQLGNHDAVIGPAHDGGYWLIGMKGTPPHGLFANVRWSSEHAMADTLATMPGLRVAKINTLRDVDTADDLKTVFPATTNARRANPRV